MPDGTTTKGVIMLRFNPSNITQTVAFSGHRPEKLPFGNDLSHPDAIRLRTLIANEIKALYKKGYFHYISGMARGIDMLCAELILEMKKDYPRLELICALPCFHQSDRWPEEDKKRYDRICSEAYACQCVTESEYFKGCMQVRNRFLVESSGLLIAGCNGQKSGTTNTIGYAQKKGKKIVVFIPENFTRVVLIENEEQLTMFD